MAGRNKNGVFVRTQLDLGDFCDDELNNEPSMTDPSHDVSIEDLIKKMIRGEAVPTTEGTFDGELSNDLSPADLMERQPIYEREGFDITQAGPILDAAAAAAAPQEQPAPTPPVPAAPPVQPTAADLPEAGQPN